MQINLYMAAPPLKRMIYNQTFNGAKSHVPKGQQRHFVISASFRSVLSPTGKTVV